MPIIGLTDRPGSFPQIGQLRKGSTKQEKTSRDGRTYSVYGSDLRGFRFTTQDADAAEQFKAAYGDEPQSVQIYLPYPSVDENFIAWREHWEHGGLVHRCDGETMVRWRKPDGTYSNEKRPCPKDGKCKQVGRLMVILPVLQRLAYVTVMTSSIHDIIQISENLKAMVALRGSLQGVPMILSRREREISAPGEDGKRVRRKKWLLYVEADPRWVEVQLLAMERKALGQLPAEPRASLVDTRYGQVDTETGEIFDEPEDDTEQEEATEAERAPEQAQAVPVPEDAITIRQREQAERERLTKVFAAVREQLRRDGGKPRSMKQSDFDALSNADLQREIDEIKLLLGPEEQRHAA